MWTYNFRTKVLVLTIVFFSLINLSMCSLSPAYAQTPPIKWAEVALAIDGSSQQALVVQIGKTQTAFSFTPECNIMRWTKTKAANKGEVILIPSGNIKSGTQTWKQWSSVMKRHGLDCSSA